MKHILLVSLCVFCLAQGSRRYKNYETKKFKWSSLVPAEKVGKVSLIRDENALNRFEVYQEWREFKQKHGKSYESSNEERRRFAIFTRNKKRINRHNGEYERGIHKFNLSMNEYGDMTHREFVSTMNGFLTNKYQDSLAKYHSSLFMQPHHFIMPKNVDWRKHGYVTPVKNQGQCGSCWSFSATGALEGQHRRKTGKLVSLSEQNLIDCSGPEGNQGCNGGLMDQAFQYIKINGGIDTEKSYPYEAMDDRCRFERAEIGANDTGFMDIPEGDERKLQAAVATVGPVSVAIDASHSSFQFYHTGVYFEPECSSTALDHGVLVAGYGVSEDNVEYWLVKNSWGTTWGDEGYIKMARNRDNMCGIASKASYPLV